MTILATIFIIGIVLLAILPTGGTRREPVEVVIAKTPQEAFQKRSYRYGSEYGTAYIVTGVEVEYQGCDRWHVFYTVRKKDASPLTDMPMGDCQ